MKYLLQLIVAESKNSCWKFMATEGSVGMYVLIPFEGSGFSIVVVSQEDNATGMILADITTKQQLNTFLLLLSGPGTDENPYVYKLGFRLTHYSKAGHKDNGHPDLSVCNGMTYSEKIEQKSSAYETMLPFINLFSTCNISDTLLKGGFVQLLDGRAKRICHYFKRGCYHQLLFFLSYKKMDALRCVPTSIITLITDGNG